MSKQILLKALFILQLGFLTAAYTIAQCPGGLTAAQTNWDNLDYYYNSGLNVAPYGYRFSSTNFCYVTDAMEQTQKYTIGTNSFTIATSTPGLVNPAAGVSAENALHTGELAGYTGEDVQYNPSVVGETITITFESEVSNVSFTLYDIDMNASIGVGAANAALVPVPVITTTQPGSILTVTGGVAQLITDLTNTALANNSNLGSATINIAGPVKTIVIGVAAAGTNPEFWLSDINACVTGTFPTNWHQGANNRPFWGPTQSQPDYFLVTPDNTYAYMVDPATGVARAFFSDPALPYINSLGYDPYNRYLYYISENTSPTFTNRALKRYDYNTETISVLIPDITAAPFNIPTFNAGVESAACAFYNGALYFGVEGGRHSTGGGSPVFTTREAMVWRIDIDAITQLPTGASQVYASDSYTSGTSSSLIHDWADIIIKNGIIYDFNSSVNGSNYSQSKYHHYDMMTGAVTNVYNNPGTTIWTGQSGMTWAGDLYYFRRITSSINSVVGTYNEAGGNGAPVTITVASGPAWPGNSGDASDPIRPKCDFGDAPASYDPYVTPATQSPAVHERTENIRLGATWDYEFLKRGVTGTNDVDDGIGTVYILSPGGGGYLAYVSAYNNSGSPATMIGWLDYNGNGLFDASEAATPITVPSSASAQNFWLSWPSTPNSFVAGDFTYMRIRITSQSAAMTTAHATGYFNNGEVEDYRVPIDNFPLSVNNLSFNASLINNSSANLKWTGNEDDNFTGYEIQKSKDANNWELLDIMPSNGHRGNKQYEFVDNAPYAGITYYRLKFAGANGNRYSEVRSVKKSALSDITIKPNPVTTVANVSIDVAERTTTEMMLITTGGKQIFHQKMVLHAGANNAQIPIKSEWPAGMYILRVVINNETTNKKLIIYK